VHQTSQTRLTHSAVVTAANVHDKHPRPDLLHGNEQRVYGELAYASQKALIASKAPQAKDFTNQQTRHAGEVDEMQRAKNLNKSRVRARVGHVFAVVKRPWGFTSKVIDAGRRLTRLQALDTITRNGAFLSFDEGSKGMLEAGKRADVAVLSAAPCQYPTKNSR